MIYNVVREQTTTVTDCLKNDAQADCTGLLYARACTYAHAHRVGVGCNGSKFEITIPK